MKVEIAEILDKYVINKEKDRVLIQSPSPINTLGQLREALKDFPDNTIIALGLVPMWKEGVIPEIMGHKRAHRLIMLKEGVLKSGNKYVCLMAGQDITDKVWETRGLDIENDTSTSNKEDSH